MTTLRQAAEAVVDSWDATYIAALRTALEVPEPEPEIKVLQAKCVAFNANTQLALDDLAAMTAERDAYQRAADRMAMSHKIERDALLLANLDLKNWFDAIKFDYDALMAAAKPALEALEHVEWKNWRTDKAITALKAAVRRQPSEVKP